MTPQHMVYKEKHKKTFGALSSYSIFFQFAMEILTVELVFFPAGGTCEFYFLEDDSCRTQTRKPSSKFSKRLYVLIYLSNNFLSSIFKLSPEHTISHEIISSYNFTKDFFAFNLDLQTFVYTYS